MTSEDALSTVHASLSYDPETGFINRKLCSQRKDLVGKRAGSLKSNGYRVIKVCGVTFFEHRLIWWMVHGTMPDFIDHKNCVKTDNRIGNLRPATKLQNNVNKPIGKNNTTGFKGVKFQKDCKRPFRATIKRNGRVEHLGLFDTPEAAHQAYVAAVKEIHGEFAHD